MIQIERLTMHLPAGFEHRATSIAHLVGDALSKQHISHDVSVESLSITSQRLALNTSDAEIAQYIVNQIVSSYEGRQ